MRHLRGHVAITQPTTWQLGQERGLIAEHRPVLASVGVLGWFEGISALDVGEIPLLRINFTHRGHIFARTTKRSKLSSPTDVFPNLSTRQLARFPSANRLIGGAT